MGFVAVVDVFLDRWMFDRLIGMGLTMGFFDRWLLPSLMYFCWIVGWLID
jgi:hypothetical protein